MLARRRCIVLLAGIAVLAAPAAAQQRFEATVSRVRVDVIVRGDHGEFVSDLTIDSFRVFEDGAEQQILGVQLVDLPARRLLDRSSRAGSGVAATYLAADPDPTAGNFNERSSDFGAMVFLVDFQGLDFRNKARFTQAWEDLIVQTESLQVPRAVYLVDQVGRLEELAPLTQDPALLLAAAEQVSERSNVRKSLRDERIEEADAVDVMVRAYDDRDRAMYTYELLTQFADGLSARPGRTALVWVSTGVQLMYGDAFSTGGLAEAGRPSFQGSPNPQILARQRDFHRAANSANVSVYTVDPTPKVALVGGMADVRYGPIGEDGVTPLAGALQLGHELDARRNSLRLASNETGGRSFIGWADLTEVLRDIEEDTGRYYLLTYAAPAPEGDGEYHDIRVEVLRDDIDVRARDGYYDYDAGDRRSRFVSAALSLPGTVADLPIVAQATRSWSADGTAIVMLTAAVGAEHVGLSIDADGVFAGLEIHAAALDEWLDVLKEHHDRIQRRLRPLRLPGGGVATPAGVTPIPSLPAGELLVYRTEWALDPGDYDLRVMMLDETTGRVGAARIALEIPDDPFGAWRTSDLMLIETDAANHRRPVVAGRLPAGRVVSAFIEVFGGAAPSVSGFIEAIDSPESALKPGVELLETPLFADADGIHRGAVVLPPLTPGSYRLLVDVEDAVAGRARGFEVDLRVLPVAGAQRRD